MTRSFRLLFVLSVVASLAWLSTGLMGQNRAGAVPSLAAGDWPHYTADMRGGKYSPLDQINAANFKTLEVAWRFKTDNLGPRPEFKLEGTPLMVNGVLYTTGGTRRSVVALDAQDRRADLGAQPARRARAPPSRRASCRAAASSYWTDGRGDERILYVTTGYRLVALNAKTGALDRARSATTASSI